MIISDSIQVAASVSPENGEAKAAVSYGGSSTAHPFADVLSKLPSNATEQQKDSAIQSVINPVVIHYSSCPDTLRLPGQPAQRKRIDVSKPMYNQSSYFKNNSYYHPELKMGRYGVPGDVVPYLASQDDVISSALLVCAMLTIVVISRSFLLFVSQLKGFFSPMLESTIKQRETFNEILLQSVLVIQLCMLLGLTFFDYVQSYVSSTFLFFSEYIVMAIFSCVFLAFCLLHEVILYWVNLTFFDGQKARTYLHFSIFTMALSGILLLPVTYVHVYYGLSIESVAIFVVSLLILVKILTFYQSYRIFFAKNIVKLQIFLYFCTLEILPLAALWGILMQIANNLTIRGLM